MPNHLNIPFKKTYPAHIRSAVREYLDNNSEDHPDIYRQDIAHWIDLRAVCVQNDTTIDAFLHYHAQLVFVLAKFPSDIGLEFAYGHVFAPEETVTLHSLPFERAAILFNLAVRYSQLAASEDRSNQNGLKHAALYYQNAAGTFAFLRTSALPKLIIPPNVDQTPLDLSPSFIHSVEFLMLAQAQECAWQRAVADHYKNSLIAKLAAGVASLYTSSLDSLRAASSDVRDTLPPTWIPHLGTKQRHFRAAAQYRKSIDDLEANDYGTELRRLINAEAEARQGYNAAKRSAISPAAVQDIKSLLDALQKDLARAERDNDLIYHKEIPTSSATVPIQALIMVQSNPPSVLSDPRSMLDGDRVPFADLLGWGAREAVNIYNDHKQTLIKERITDFAHELDDEMDQTLRSLNLPSSLEALERPIGLPPSFLKKAEEVRSEDGPERIETYLENIDLLAHRAMKIMDEAMDVLDSEASEDETVRKAVPVKRPPSHEANRELVQRQERYRSALMKATESDEVVRQKWREWEASIVQLALDENELENLIPSSTISAVEKKQAAGSQTQVLARALRGLLETLDEVRSNRNELVSRAQRRCEVDDIRPRIVTAASKFDRDDEITPAMFTEISDEELAKYDKFIQGLAEGQKKQSGLLESIKSTNENFLSSRKGDSSVKEREQALQSLDLAYAKYREITRNLEEGHKFYNDMTNILTRFKEACRAWSSMRSQEAQSFYRKFASMSVQDADVGPATETPRREKRIANLPSLSSAEWQTEELPPPPPSSKGK